MYKRQYGGIIRIDEEQVQLMKRRGGVGHDLSHIRPKGSPVKNSALTSTGLVPFMERYSNSTREVAQDGRRGALMLLSLIHIYNGNFVFRFRMWGRNVSEQFAFKYYTATLKDVYTYEVPFYMQHTGKQTLNINLDEHGFMDLYVRLPETLRPYMREGDDMAAFVNGYPCSIVQDRLQENYMLKMKGRKGDKVSFRFYSDSLKHVFATPDCVTYALSLIHI